METVNRNQAKATGYQKVEEEKKPFAVFSAAASQIFKEMKKEVPGI